MKVRDREVSERQVLCLFFFDRKLCSLSKKTLCWMRICEKSGRVRESDGRYVCVSGYLSSNALCISGIEWDIVKVTGKRGVGLWRQSVCV